MIQELDRIADLRSEAEQILGEGVARSMPLAMSVLAVRALFEKENVPVPDDVLAFVSGGRVTAAMVRDWSIPFG